MRIAIYGSRRQQGAFSTVASFLRLLADRGDSVVMHRKLYRHLLEACVPLYGSERRRFRLLE